MTCCSARAQPLMAMIKNPRVEEQLIASREISGGIFESELSVGAIHCANCIRAIETGMRKLEGVERVRVNLSTKRVNVHWHADQAPDLVAALEEIGFAANFTEAERKNRDPELRRLVLALAVAGFCSMNVMMFSVGVWAGADPATRHAFHWISAFIALPCLLYSGRIYFQSAWAALRHGRTNMDVPISIGVILAYLLSLYDTVHNGTHAYFDAATSLIFFLLIGRTLDYMMREKARSAVEGLIRLVPNGATIENEDGGRSYLPVDAIKTGMRMVLAAGDRVPVDGEIAEGISELDCAIATGETAPRRVEPGMAVQAGMLNLTAPLIIRATATAKTSFLAQMLRLMEAAEDGRAHYRRIADRAAELYSPVVHSMALLTFIGWLIATGDWHQAITIAIAVLIITCPCALGLAVPIVQVVAAKRLFENGILVKDGSAIERMNAVNAVVFDKTGTLTLGSPVAQVIPITADKLTIAAAMARQSNHPYSKAIARKLDDLQDKILFLSIQEYAGFGLQARIGEDTYRLGRADWALSDIEGDKMSGTVFSCNGKCAASFAFLDELRPFADEAIRQLHQAGIKVLLLSGDQEKAVLQVSNQLHIDNYAAGLLPADKVSRLNGLKVEGYHTLMVGDGLNDAPALAAAHVSMAPASAADIGRNAADFVFLHKSLAAVPAALSIAQASAKLVRENFVLAIIYNAIAIPVAVAGYVTPLIAALAMSVSSIMVVANALRLKAGSLKPVAKS
ncbi:Copper-exporting P-type ATPase [Paenochrobactrum sp. BZR 201-1]